jgi:hypothetical protein
MMVITTRIPLILEHMQLSRGDEVPEVTRWFCGRRREGPTRSWIFEQKEKEVS